MTTGVARRRRPILGLFAGALAGLGASILIWLTGFPPIPTDFVFIGFVVLGGLSGWFRRGRPPNVPT